MNIRLQCTARVGSALKDLPWDAVQPPLEPQPVVGLVLIDQSLGPHVLLEGPLSADSWAASTAAYETFRSSSSIL